MSGQASLDLSAIRQEYIQELLDERHVASNPLDQFRAWFDEAVKADLPMVNAMTLATTSQDGEPSARVVLLKEVDHGFVFYTDYASRKGRELDATGRAALVVYWIELQRQVRIEARVEKTSAEESDEYYATRPLGSRIACGASTQSEVVRDRETLERRFAEAERRCGGAPSRPATWGGYRLIPHAVEFWQGRPNRLHDRLLYRKTAEGQWEIVRLAP